MKRKAKAKIFSLQTYMVIAIAFLVGITGLIAVSMFGEKEPVPMEQQALFAGDIDFDLPDTSSVTLDVINKANESATGIYDNSGYLYTRIGNDDVYKATITDTTSPTALSLNYGDTYIFKPIGSTGANGDSGYVLSAKGAEQMNIVNGNVEFVADKATMAITMYMNQHATLECKARDLILSADMYNTGAGETATDYETDGVTWMSTTDENTTYDETQGINIQFKCQAVEADTDYNDKGVYFLIDVGTASEVEVPDVTLTYRDKTDLSITGKPRVKTIVLDNVKGTSVMNSKEITAYANSEWIYLIPESASIKNGGAGFDIVVNMPITESSVTTNPQFDFAVRTQYKSTTSTDVLTGSVTDAIAPATVHVHYDMSLNVTE